MDNKEIEITIINDIIQIHNDRFEGYYIAAGELHPEDEDLKTILMGMSQQSATYKTILLDELQVLTENSELQTIHRGRTYHTWQSVKVAFGGPDRQTILNSCEIGEDAIIKAYQTALDTKDLPLNTKSILETQQTELRAAYNHIKELRSSIS